MLLVLDYPTAILLIIFTHATVWDNPTAILPAFLGLFYRWSVLSSLCSSIPAFLTIWLKKDVCLFLTIARFRITETGMDIRQFSVTQWDERVCGKLGELGHFQDIRDGSRQTRYFDTVAKMSKDNQTNEEPWQRCRRTIKLMESSGHREREDPTAEREITRFGADLHKNIPN